MNTLCAIDRDGLPTTGAPQHMILTVPAEHGPGDLKTPPIGTSAPSEAPLLVAERYHFAIRIDQTTVLQHPAGAQRAFILARDS